MVPFTIFHRLSSLGSGGGVNAGTIPPVHGTERAISDWRARFGVYLYFYGAALDFFGDPGHLPWVLNHFCDLAGELPGLGRKSPTFQPGRTPSFPHSWRKGWDATIQNSREKSSPPHLPGLS
jgi:hypothetical protein